MPTASLSGERQGVDDFWLDLAGDCTIDKVEFHYFDSAGSEVKLSKVDPCSRAKSNEDCFSESFPWILKGPLVIERARSLKVCKEALPLTWGYTPGFRVMFVEAVVRVRGEKKAITAPRMPLRPE